MKFQAMELLFGKNTPKQMIPKVTLLAIFAILVFTVTPLSYPLFRNPSSLKNIKKTNQPSTAFDDLNESASLPSTSIKKCDIFTGEWVPNPKGPYYTNKTCWAIHEHQNCMKYGRPDSDYLKWKWKPNGCELPIFNPFQFLEIVRGKSMAFVGDSVGRNQMQSMICLLSRVEWPVVVSHSQNDYFMRWHYPTYNFTMASFWTPHLVRSKESDLKGPGSTGLFDLYIDEPDENWITQIEDFNYVILNGGHWFTRSMVFYEKQKIVAHERYREPFASFNNLLLLLLPSSLLTLHRSSPLVDLQNTISSITREVERYIDEKLVMARKSTNCAICENLNQPSICSVCVNYRLNEYNSSLKSLKERRDSLYSKLSEVLVRKGKGDDQTNWRVLRHEKLARSREKLRHNKEQVTQGRAKIQAMSADLKLKYGVLESALSMLEKNRVEQLEKFYPNLICTQSLGHVAITSERLHKQSVVIKQICKLFPQRRVVIEGEKGDDCSGQYDQICNARLPRALDPHSVPSEELSASLGYMVQLLNLVAHNLAAPALHNSGFAGSCSRIWQRDSYWDARPSSRSNEYPLFIPRQNYCSTSGENSWSEKSSSNFGVASMESDRRPRLDSSGSSSFNYSLASSHSVQSHKDLQKGISLLKKSVACITAYCYNSLCFDIPSEASTFEAFAKLLATLSSSKEVRSVFSLKMARSRTCKQVQQLNKSVWNMNSANSSTTLLESTHSVPTTRIENYMPNSAASFLYPTDSSDRKSECLIEGWDIVEHPTLPPPPSQSEDVEHWTRAMFIDAKRK